MASTPAVGPRPTTRTNTSAQISSGMLRSTISVARTSQRSTAGQRSMRPDKADNDKTRVAKRLKGTASTSASVTPAVAMATVRQVSRTTMSMNSALWISGQKVDKNCAVTFRFSGSHSTHKRNSVATANGHNSTKARLSQNTRWKKAGSRAGASKRGRGVGRCETEAVILGVAQTAKASTAVHHHRHRLAGRNFWRGHERRFAAQLVFVLVVQMRQALGADLCRGQVKHQLPIAQANDAREVRQRHVHLV